MNETPAAVFRDLNAMQAAGRACIVCTTSYVTFAEPVPDSVVVGTAWSTGEEVRACEIGCARLVGWVPESADWEQPSLL